MIQLAIIQVSVKKDENVEYIHIYWTWYIFRYK